jgi:hypothetical protein
VLQLFNMPPEDYKAFLSFLRKHQCHMPFFRFRCLPVPVEQQAVAAGSATSAPSSKSAMPSVPAHAGAAALKRG